MQFEVHFQEGFTGQAVSISAGGKVVFTAAATTKLMIGLALIAPLDMEDGTPLQIDIEPAIKLETTADASRPFIIVNLEEGKATLTAEARQPGYV